MKINPGNARGLLVPQGDRPFSFVVYSSEIRDFGNDVAKYFAIIPAAFSSTYPSLSVLNVTGLETPESAMLSAVIFNALIIVALIPIALKGVHYKAWSAARLLKHNLLVYGLGGVIIPFAGIKLIDMVINVF